MIAINELINTPIFRGSSQEGKKKRERERENKSTVSVSAGIFRTVYIWFPAALPEYLTGRVVSPLHALLELFVTTKWIG